MRNRNTKYYIGGAVILVFALIFFGGGSNRGSNQNSSMGNVHATNNSEQALVGDFTLKKLDGGEITLSDYRGDKPVILDFFATWCPNCRRDMPKLSAWYQIYSDQVEIIGVNLQERSSVVSRYIESANISFPIVLDPKSSASRTFAIKSTNNHILINTDGSIFRIIPGDISEQDIVSFIEAQPQESSATVEVIGDESLEVNILE